MFRYWVSATRIAGLVAGSVSRVRPEAFAKNTATTSRIDLQHVDHSVGPRDALYRYLKGVIEGPIELLAQCQCISHTCNS